MKADEKEKKIIPLENRQEVWLERGLVPIEAYYDSTSNLILSIFYANVDFVSITVTNLSTGEVWYDTFDSGVQSQNMTLISGTPGWYEVVYKTASGDVYSGLFEI